MRKPTFKQVAYASATASLLITMASPALAGKSEENSAGSRVRIHRSLGERQHESGSKRNSKPRNQDRRELGRNQISRSLYALTAAQQEGIKEAHQTMEAALAAARTARDAAFAQASGMTDAAAARLARQEAVQDYREARDEAQKAFRTERELLLKATE